MFTFKKCLFSVYLLSLAPLIHSSDVCNKIDVLVTDMVNTINDPSLQQSTLNFHTLIQLQHQYQVRERELITLLSQDLMRAQRTQFDMVCNDQVGVHVSYTASHYMGLGEKQKAVLIYELSRKLAEMAKNPHNKKHAKTLGCLAARLI